MKFFINVFNKNALHIAIEKGNSEIAHLLLEKNFININDKSISNHLFLT